MTNGCESSEGFEKLVDRGNLPIKWDVTKAGLPEDTELFYFPLD